MEDNQNGIRKRRKLSGEKKYQILEELKRNPEKKGEILRREGLYTTDIQRYEEIVRVSGIKALSASRPGKKRAKEVTMEGYEAMERDLAKKENALAELSVEFVALKKKVNGE